MKVVYQSKEILLPDFLVVGASRSGTTSLYSYLKNHPDVFMPALKEPQFFSYLGEAYSPHTDDIRSEPWNVEDYLGLFGSTGPGQILGEASTSYLYIYPRTQNNIRKLYGDRMKKLKIIGVLRDPVSRAWSTYMLRKQGGGWTEDFFTIARELEAAGDPYEYYNFLRSGLYYEQVKAYQTRFPLSRFFLFEELTSEPERVFKEILEFVGARKVFVASNVGKQYNFSGVPRNVLVAPLYRLLFERSRFKTSLKWLLPESVRMTVKRIVGSKVIKKSGIPDNIRHYLREKYETDLTQLIELFPDERQKRIIQGWLAS